MTEILPGDLLLVEDDANLRKALARALGGRGFTVAAFGTVAEATDHLAAVGANGEDGAAPRFAVLDLRLPDGSGLDLVPLLLERSPGARAVILTGWGSIATALRALRLGAVDFLAKPVDVSSLVRALFDEARDEADEREDAIPTLDQVEWEHLQRVLEESDGNVSLAARRLGLHRRSLQRKLSKRPTTF